MQTTPVTDAVELSEQSELELPQWSIVSFDRLEGTSLSYNAAFKLLEDLDRRGVAGLCLITDEAAERFAADLTR